MLDLPLHENRQPKIEPFDNDDMLTFNIAGFLTDFTSGRSEISINSSAATVGEALNELWQVHVGLRDRVVNEQGHLRPHVNIFLNGENIRRKQVLTTVLEEGSEITILPAVSGGDGTIPSPLYD